MLFRGKVFLTGKEKPCIIEFDDSQGMPEPGVFVIYGFIDPRTNDVFYVGQTDGTVLSERKQPSEDCGGAGRGYAAARWQPRRAGDAGSGRARSAVWE
jgi:hypothetical protein